jgi:hypothetical protein
MRLKMTLNYFFKDDKVKRCERTGLIENVKHMYLSWLREWLKEHRRKLPAPVYEAIIMLIPELRPGAAYVEPMDDL